MALQTTENCKNTWPTGKRGLGRKRQPPERTCDVRHRLFGYDRVARRHLARARRARSPKQIIITPPPMVCGGGGRAGGPWGRYTAGRPTGRPRACHQAHHPQFGPILPLARLSNEQASAARQYAYGVAKSEVRVRSLVRRSEMFS